MLFDFTVIAVDFDGTLCENKWPGIGEPNEKLISHLNFWKKDGHKLILWTCRTGKMLDEAVAWCTDHGLSFDAVNDNVAEAIEEFGGDSRKIFADYYIDDHNVDCYVFDIPFIAHEEGVD